MMMGLSASGILWILYFVVVLGLFLGTNIYLGTALKRAENHKEKVSIAIMAALFTLFAVLIYGFSIHR